MKKQCTHITKKMMICHTCNTMGCEKCIKRNHKEHCCKRAKNYYKKAMVSIKAAQRSSINLFLINFARVHLYHIAKGTKEVWLYNPIYKYSKKIEIATPFPKHSSSILLAGKIYIVGGFENSKFSDKIYEIDLINKKLLHKSNIYSAREDITIAKHYDEMALCVGGQDAYSSDCVEAYYPLQTKCVKMPNLIIRRRCCGVCVFREGWAYAYGGCGDIIASNVNQIERFNLIAKTAWEIIAVVDNMGPDMSGYPLNNKEMMIMGGYINKKENDECRVFNCEANKFVGTLGSLVEPALFYRTSFPIYECKKIYFVSDIGCIHIFDIIGKAWDELSVEKWKKQLRKVSCI